MKKLFAMFFIMLLALGLVACTEEQEPSYQYGYGVSYGLVHGHYVGVAKVVVDKDDKVVNVQFDEYYLPYNFAQVVVADVENVPADVLPVVGARGTSYYAKFVSINGTLFTGAVSGDAGSQSITYSATGIADIEEWVKTETNAKAYVDGVEAGTVFIANANGTKSSYAQANANAKLGWTKSSTHYWTSRVVTGALVYYPLGWGGNMQAIAEALVGTTMNATEAQLVFSTTWSIGDITTGATLSDFVDYYLLAQVAYNNALAGKE
jgi:hypothetical protein